MSKVKLKGLKQTLVKNIVNNIIEKPNSFGNDAKITYLLDMYLCVVIFVRHENMTCFTDIETCTGNITCKCSRSKKIN